MYNKVFFHSLYSESKDVISSNFTILPDSLLEDGVYVYLTSKEGERFFRNILREPLDDNQKEAIIRKMNSDRVFFRQDNSDGVD